MKFLITRFYQATGFFDVVSGRSDFGKTVKQGRRGFVCDKVYYFVLGDFGRVIIKGLSDLCG